MPAPQMTASYVAFIGNRSDCIRRLVSLEFLPEFLPTRFHHYGTIREDDGWHAFVAIVDSHDELRSLLVSFETDAEIGDFVGIEELPGAHAVGAILGRVHHDLGWVEGMVVGHVCKTCLGDGIVTFSNIRRLVFDLSNGSYLSIREYMTGCHFFSFVFRKSIPAGLRFR